MSGLGFRLIGTLPYALACDFRLVPLEACRRFSSLFKAASPFDRGLAPDLMAVAVLAPPPTGFPRTAT